jgi:hypothetical protein
MSRIRQAGLGAVLALLLACTLGACGSGDKKVTTNPSSAQPAPTATSTPCTSKVTVNPTAATTSTNEGVRFTGTATCLPAGSTLWPVDKSDKYYRDSDTPLIILDDQFAIRDESIGSPYEQHSTVDVEFIIANPACDAALRAVKPNQDGDEAFDTLPAGCTVATSAKVTVNNG